MNPNPPGPLLASLRPPTTGVEVRPLDQRHCVVTVGERHHLAGIPAATASQLLSAWRAGREDLVDPELARAAAPLRALLEEAGGSGQAPSLPEAGPVTPRPGLRALLSGDEEMLTALRGRLHGSDPVQIMPWPGVRPLLNRAFEEGTMLVVAVRGAREAELVDLDRSCHDMRVPWFPLELVRGRIWAGPLVTPGEGANYEDAVARRRAAARDARVHRAVRIPAPEGDQGPAPTELAPVLDAALELSEAACRALADAGEGGGDVLYEVFAEQGEVRTVGHPVLPMPHRRCRQRRHRPQDLLDERTGLVLRVREVRHDPKVPPGLVTRQSDVSDIRAVTAWANNVLCQGSAFDDPEAAQRAAIGESVERYCGNILDTLPVTVGSHRELRARGLPALDPRELVLYSEEQYRAPGFPFVPMTRELRIHWVPGRRIGSGEEVLVPASLVYVNWYSAGFAAAPPTNFCAFAGIAAGPDEDFAVASAIEEIVERHATMVWWLNAQPLPRVREFRPPVGAERLRIAALHLDNEFGVPVAAVVVHDDEDRLVNIGFSARPSFAQAADKALSEALTLQEGSRDLLRADGLHWRVMADGELNGRAFKPWRADRAYLDDFREDMRDCDDLMVQQQVYLDPRAGRRMARLLEPQKSRSARGLPELSGRSAGDYLRAMSRAGIDPVVVDITTPDVRSTGLRVVRVVAPGAVGNAPAAFPFLGRRRVQEIPVELGWRERPLAESALNFFPMPHA